jgi:hypothetical protein
MLGVPCPLIIRRLTNLKEFDVVDLALLFCVVWMLTTTVEGEDNRA